MVFEVMVEGKNQVWTHFYYVTEMFFINNFFSWQLFSEFLKFIQKTSLVQTLWSFQGVKKVCRKKVIALFLFPRGREGGKQQFKVPAPSTGSFQ